MGRIRSWWKNTSKMLRVVIIISLAILIAFLVVNILGYIFLWDWTGLVPHVSPSHPQNTDFQPGKTLWDWYQLLIIPVVLVVGGFLLNFTTSRTEREIASDKQREDALQAYIDSMSALLLEKNLRNSAEEDEVRTIARVRTLTVLPRLDGKRKGTVLIFLHESGLIKTGMNKKVVDLLNADLTGANLGIARPAAVDLSGACMDGVNLTGANLEFAVLDGVHINTAYIVRANLFRASLSNTRLRLSFLLNADLRQANLREADLHGAHLNGAKLHEADLQKANLDGTDLSGADLSGANYSDEQLEQARSLKGAILRDGRRHP
jgi:uncharacterized protein YjbI with pentapeptide repeats